MNKLAAGFSAVELLITLFIGSVFLFAGYQLATQLSKDSADTTKTAIISNMLYDKMRQVETRTGDRCIYHIYHASPSVAGFKGAVQIDVSYTCPFGGSSPITLVNAKATYNDGVSTKVLYHAMYQS